MPLPTTEDLVFVTTDAQLLRFPAGRPPAGPRGRRHGRHPARPRARVVFFGAVDPAADRRRHLGRLLGALPGTQPGSLKVTPYAEYPAKGRATGGVGHTGSCAARTPSCSPGSAPRRPAPRPQRRPVELPEATGKRDGSGTTYPAVIAAIAPARIG